CAKGEYDGVGGQQSHQRERRAVRAERRRRRVYRVKGQCAAISGQRDCAVERNADIVRRIQYHVVAVFAGSGESNVVRDIASRIHRNCREGGGGRPWAGAAVTAGYSVVGAAIEEISPSSRRQREGCSGRWRDRQLTA